MLNLVLLVFALTNGHRKTGEEYFYTDDSFAHNKTVNKILESLSYKPG